MDALVDTGLAKSKGAARRLLGQGGVYVNNERSEDPERRLVPADVAAGSIIVLRTGRKRYHLVRLV